MLQVLINQKVYLADKITTHDDHVNILLLKNLIS